MKGIIRNFFAFFVVLWIFIPCKAHQRHFLASLLEVTFPFAFCNSKGFSVSQICLLVNQQQYKKHWIFSNVCRKKNNSNSLYVARLDSRDQILQWQLIRTEQMQGKAWGILLTYLELSPGAIKQTCCPSNNE